jgi:hypothetical protein
VAIWSVVWSGVVFTVACSSTSQVRLVFHPPPGAVWNYTLHNTGSGKGGFGAGSAAPPQSNPFNTALDARLSVSVDSLDSNGTVHRHLDLSNAHAARNGTAQSIPPTELEAAVSVSPQGKETAGHAVIVAGNGTSTDSYSFDSWLPSLPSAPVSVGDSWTTDEAAAPSTVASNSSRHRVIWTLLRIEDHRGQRSAHIRSTVRATDSYDLSSKQIRQLNPNASLSRLGMIGHETNQLDITADSWVAVQGGRVLDFRWSASSNATIHYWAGGSESGTPAATEHDTETEVETLVPIAS